MRRTEHFNCSTCPNQYRIGRDYRCLDERVTRKIRAGRKDGCEFHPNSCSKRCYVGPDGFSQSDTLPPERVNSLGLAYTD